jgi:hypothetical protein
MSTRKAKDDSVFQQARYASSPEFERGLIANLVARRCSVLENKSDRELVWFIQHLSHQAGGVPEIARDLISNPAGRLQTPAMGQIGMKPGKICNAAQVKLIRAEIPLAQRTNFLLKGEDGILDVRIAEDFKKHDLATDRAIADAAIRGGASESETNNHPTNYPAQAFVDFCHKEASAKLENYLRELCVNPAIKLGAGPWYFPGLITSLREFQADFIKAKSGNAFTTALGGKVFEVLDYTAYCRGLTLIQGEARLGKSHAARAWCDQHPGSARFVEVPSGNDDVTFQLAVAADFRPEPRHHQHHHQRPEPAHHHGQIAPVAMVLPMHRAEQMLRHAGLEAAQLVGRADEQAVHRRDAPALVVRRQDLHQRLRARRRSRCPPRRTAPSARTPPRTTRRPPPGKIRRDTGGWPGRTKSSPRRKSPRTGAWRGRPFAAAAGARGKTRRGSRPWEWPRAAGRGPRLPRRCAGE